MEIIEELEDEAEISLSGNFILNNKQCNFESQGFVDIVDYENELLYIGSIDGSIYIDDIEREINVSFEKSPKNEYLALTINNLGNEEGFAILKTGKSILTKESIKTIFNINMDDSNINDDEVENIRYESKYDDVDKDYEELDRDSDGSDVIRQILYVEDDIYADADDGRILTVVNSYNDRVERIFDDKDAFAVKVDELRVYFTSEDEESSFGFVHPTEDDDDDVEDFVQDVLGDLGVPWSITDLVKGIGDRVRVYDEDEGYERSLKITPKDDSIIDNRKAGFPVTLYVNLDTEGAKSDEIESRAKLEYQVFYYEDYDGEINAEWFTIDTDKTRTSVDLTKYVD